MPDTMHHGIAIHSSHIHLVRGLQTAHKVLRRSIDAIIDTAPTVHVRDRGSFLAFVKAFSKNIHHHHHLEENIMFPLLQGMCNAMDETDRLHDEHADLVLTIMKLDEAREARPYDGSRIAAAAQALKDEMIKHLDYEESVYSAMVVARANPALVEEVERIIQKDVAQSSNPFVDLPFLALNLTKEEQKFMIFDGRPWYFKKILWPLVYSRRYKRAWSFASRRVEEKNFKEDSGYQVVIHSDTASSIGDHHSLDQDLTGHDRLSMDRSRGSPSGPGDRGSLEVSDNPDRLSLDMGAVMLADLQGHMFGAGLGDKLHTGGPDRSFLAAELDHSIREALAE